MPPIVQSQLPNGLQIILSPMRAAPVASFWVWYRVGSRNEVTGMTGIFHWIEHMLFKGTHTLKKGDVFRLTHRNGGANNAITSTDFTTFFETLPSDRIDLALRIESDRMVNALFDPVELESERNVVISEREANENDPSFWLDEEMQALTFIAHPYQHETIGWKSDLRALTRDDLYQHYQQYYGPNNAVIVAAGDFDPDDMLGRIERAFGPLAPRGPFPAVRAVEPPQLSERRVTVRRPAPAAYFQLNYHGPRAGDADYFPVFVLRSVLGGVTVTSRAWRTRAGRTSRLYRALVDTQMVTSVSCNNRLTIDPGTIEVAAVARAGVAPAEIERVVLGEIDRLRGEPITEEELEQVVQQTRAQYVYATEGVSNLAYWLGTLEIAASHAMQASFAERVAQVTKADVQRAAQTYLSETNRTLGWLIPPGGA